MAQSDDGGAFLILAAVGALYFFAPTSWTNSLWYGIEYKVSFSDVHTADRPKDCDFMHAPLGDKGCT